MFAELFVKNIFNLTVILSSVFSLILMNVFFRHAHKRKKGFVFHTTQFLIYALMIGTLGRIANTVITHYNISAVSSSIIDFICTSLIALILTIKLFLVINQFEKSQIKKGRDVTSARILSRIIKITLIVVIILLYGEHFGMSLSGLLTFGGIGGIATG